MQVLATHYTNTISYITMQHQSEKFAGITNRYIIGSHQAIKITSRLGTRPCFHDLFRVLCGQNKVMQWSEDGRFISQTQPSIVGLHTLNASLWVLLWVLWLLPTMRKTQWQPWPCSKLIICQHCATMTKRLLLHHWCSVGMLEYFIFTLCYSHFIFPSAIWKKFSGNPSLSYVRIRH